MCALPCGVGGVGGSVGGVGNEENRPVARPVRMQALQYSGLKILRRYGTGVNTAVYGVIWDCTGVTDGPCENSKENMMEAIRGGRLAVINCATAGGRERGCV